MNFTEINPWRAAALALGMLCAALLMQIHGAPIIGGGLKPALATCEGNLAAIERAQAEAEAEQNAVNLSEERRTAANAERSDIAHAQDLPRALAAGSDYALRHRIATGGLRAESDRGGASQSPAPAESGSASLHESLPADPFVAVSAADVQACTAAVTWAVGAYNWAQTLPQTAISAQNPTPAALAPLPSHPAQSE